MDLSTIIYNENIFVRFFHECTMHAQKKSQVSNPNSFWACVTMIANFESDSSQRVYDIIGFMRIIQKRNVSRPCGYFKMNLRLPNWSEQEVHATFFFAVFSLTGYLIKGISVLNGMLSNVYQKFLILYATSNRTPASVDYCFTRTTLKKMNFLDSTLLKLIDHTPYRPNLTWI